MTMMMLMMMIVMMMMMTMMVMTNHLQVVSWPHLLHASTSSTSSPAQSSNLSLTQRQPGPATDGVEIKCGQKSRSGQTEDDDLDGQLESTGESNLRKEGGVNLAQGVDNLCEEEAGKHEDAIQGGESHHPQSSE